MRQRAVRSVLAGMFLGGMTAMVWGEPAVGAPAQPAAAAASQPAGGKPRMRVDEKVYQFGQVWDGAKVDHDFAIHNDGDAALELTSVRASCGCTAPEWDRTIAPGQKGRVRVVFNTRGKGTLAKTSVFVQTNDPQNARVELRLEGSVRQLIAIEPRTGIRFGRVVDEKVEPAKVKITSNASKPIKLEPVKPTGPHADTFAVGIAELEPGKVFEVTVAAKPPLPEGSANISLVFKTGTEEVPLVSFPVSIYVPPLIEIVPTAIVLGAPPARETPRPIDLTFNGKGQMKVLSGTSTDPAIRTNVMELLAGRRYRVLCTIPAGFNLLNDQHAEIRIETDHADRKEIVVPVSMRPLPPASPKTPRPTATPASGPARAAASDIPSAPDRPVFEAATTVFMVGRQKAGAKLDQTLYFRNGGSRPLEITRVSASEGLTVEPGYATTIAPGVAGMLALHYTTPTAPGPFEATLAIESNDPARPSIPVKLAGQVRPVIEVQPTEGVDFGRRPQTHAALQAVRLEYTGEGPINYLKAESTSPKFEAEIRKVSQAGVATVAVRAKGPFEPGENTALIQVTTDCRGQPVVEIPVVLTVPPRIDVAPAEVPVVLNAPRQQKKAVTIYVNTPEPLSILRVRRSADGILTQFFPEQDNLSYQLHVTVPAEFRPSAGGERIVIETDDPEYSQIVVPLVFRTMEQYQAQYQQSRR